MSDVGATLEFLESQPWVEQGQTAITGFCWGGKVVWNACETFPEFKAGVSWYGRSRRRRAPADPEADLADRACGRPACPVLGLYGGKDPLGPGRAGDAPALAAAGKTDSEIIIYQDAGHGFHADYRASYNEADARDGWSRLLAFFAVTACPAAVPVRADRRRTLSPGSLRVRVSRSRASWVSVGRRASMRRTACSTVVWSRPPKRRPMSGSERVVSCLASHIAAWRGRATDRVRRSEIRSACFSRSARRSPSGCRRP